VTADSTHRRGPWEWVHGGGAAGHQRPGYCSNSPSASRLLFSTLPCRCTVRS